MRNKNLFVCLCFLSALIAGCTSPAVIHGVPNLAVVEPGIYRGGQPTDAGWIYLQHLGVSNVVKLDLESEGSDRGAEDLGMSLYCLPIDRTEQIFTKPPFIDIWVAVEHMEPGTYVHCLHGSDRTGLVCGCYRLWRQAWPKEKAYREMKYYGFNPWLKGLYDFWDEDAFPIKHAQ